MKYTIDDIIWIVCILCALGAMVCFTLASAVEEWPWFWKGVGGVVMALIIYFVQLVRREP